jgi:antitoxin PrlF
MWENKHSFVSMTKKKDEPGACMSCSPSHGCKVEAVLTVDERGQMVLPKDVREKAGIRPGDKLALIGWEREGSICCLALMKVENLSGMVKGVLEPLMNDAKRS